MTLFRRLPIIGCMVFISLLSHSQQKLPKTLLWRISGHGLQQPSYLYGTMHLNDKRLFKFGDSVYHAIEQTAGLAIEVNPDEMGAYFVNKLFDQLENSRKLHDILSEKDFNKYSDRLSKKFHKPAADVTANDIVKEKNKWMADYMEKGEMPTFVDAYLYSIARRQGKWMGGIEDMADQAGLLEEMVDKSDIDYLLAGDSPEQKNLQTSVINHSLEKMIDLYSSQDLEGIQAMSDDQSSAKVRDRMLITRNVKMSRRMDSLMQFRTMFLAIGAAHLPGDSGVIYLLRKRGFTVEPVFSSRKIDEKEYHVKDIRVPWYPVEDSQGFYNTLMPGNPATIKLYGLIEMKFLLDIINMSGYCTMAVKIPGTYSNADSLYNLMAQRMFQTEAKLTPKIITTNGIEGREYQQVKKGANIRAEIFLYNKTIYCAFTYATKPSGLYEEDANKFFSSFRINKNLSTNSASTIFTDSVMGISFVSPVAVTYNKKLSNNDDEGWKISAFTGSDPANGTYVMLFSKEVKPGHFIASDSLVYEDLHTNLKKQNNIIKEEEFSIAGSRATKIYARSKLQKGLYLAVVHVLRNGRDVVVMAMSDSEHLHSAANERILETLRIVPHAPVQWKVQFSPAKEFSCIAPAEIKRITNASGSKEQYCAYDSSMAISYIIIPDTLGKYFYAENDSSYWKHRIDNNTGNDSLISQKAVTGDYGMQGMELLTKEQKSAGHYKRMRLLYDHNMQYKLFVAAEKDVLYSSPVDSFFNSFRLSDPHAGDHFITTSKTNLLLTDLCSRDSAIRYDAFMALKNNVFPAADSGALREALFKKYASPYYFEGSSSTIINNTIARQLAKLEHPSIIEYVKNSWDHFTENKDSLKNIGLNLLAAIHTQKSYAAIAELLQQSPPKLAFDYQFTNDLRDSLSLTAAIYPALQQRLAADTLFAPGLAEVANHLMDSGFLQVDKIRLAEKDFISAAQQLLPALLHQESSSYNAYTLLDLLGRYKDAAANKVLNAYLGVKALYLKKEAALQLLDNHQPVSPLVFKMLAADKGMRSSLYADLKERKKKALFPQQYLTQTAFAESNMYNTATDYGDDEELRSMVFLQKKTATYKKKQYLFYLYRVSFEGEENEDTYLGIAGGYALNGTGLEPVLDISGVYRQAALHEKNIQVLLQAYLESLDKDDNAEAEE